MTPTAARPLVDRPAMSRLIPRCTAAEALVRHGITVGRYLAAMFGRKKGGWIGKRVTVRAEKVEAFGEMEGKVSRSVANCLVRVTAPRFDPESVIPAVHASGNYYPFRAPLPSGEWVLLRESEVEKVS